MDYALFMDAMAIVSDVDLDQGTAIPLPSTSRPLSVALGISRLERTGLLP